MSKIETDKDFTTKLRNETFLHFADKSTMGIAIIQRGHLKYFNEKFSEIFGYTEEEVAQWKKREFYKIVHPEDLAHLVEFFKVENDKKTVSLRFRGVRKDKKIVNIENYICHIKYNNKTAYLSSYILLEEPYNELYGPQTIKITKKKKIVLDYQTDIIKLLKDNKIKFDIYNACSYREEN
ncbi:MAG: PAS domain-containing protein [Promethearchaeota archaeon]